MALVMTGTKEECCWELPDELYYHTDDHIWARIEGDRVLMGLDAFGLYAAGKLQYLKLLPVGRKVTKNRPFGTVESGKFIGPMRALVSGEMLEHNSLVVERPRTVNEDPYGHWIVAIRPTDLENDLVGLPHGEAEIRAWMEREIDGYRSKDLLSCD